jgi:hypothetical protein
MFALPPYRKPVTATKACQLATLAAKPAAFSITSAQSARRARSGALAMMVSIMAASRVRSRHNFVLLFAR